MKGKSSTLVIYGAGSFAREILPMVEEKANELELIKEIIFIDDNKMLQRLGNHKVISSHEFSEGLHEDFAFNVSIADPTIRKAKAAELLELKGQPISLISKEATIYRDVKVGEGAIVMPGARVSAGVSLGAFAHINFNCYIGHDVQVSDFVTISPSVNCGGGVMIKSESFIGMGAAIKQSRNKKPMVIGQNSIIGMGTNVLESVGDGKIFVGNPGKEMKTKN